MYPLQVNSTIFAHNTFGFTRPFRYLLEDVSLPNVSLSGMHLKMLKFVQRTSQVKSNKNHNLSSRFKFTKLLGVVDVNCIVGPGGVAAQAGAIR